MKFYIISLILLINLLNVNAAEVCSYNGAICASGESCDRITCDNTCQAAESLSCTIKNNTITVTRYATFNACTGGQATTTYNCSMCIDTVIDSTRFKCSDLGDSMKVIVNKSLIIFIFIVTFIISWYRK